MGFEITVDRVLARVGLRLVRRRAMRDPIELLCLKAPELGVATVLDVGANKGQFGKELRGRGWTGQLVSFEPLLEAYQQLQAAAAGDARWIVAPRGAIGMESAEAEINVSGNLASSSLLQVDGRSTRAAPESGFVRTERIEIRPLDALMQSEWAAPFALKIDTQGFELQVLKGAAATIARTNLVQLEISLAPLYSGGAGVGALFDFLEAKGFRAIALNEGFSDHARNEMLQVEGTFIRD